MRTKPTWLLMSAMLLAAASCSSNVGGAKPGPCESDKPPAECATACANDIECSGGFHCGDDKTCTAECTPTGNECADGYACDPKGRCQVDDGTNCPNVRFQGAALKATVQLLIDQSGSMNQPFPNQGDPSRWNAVRTALISQNGVVATLQNRVAFGASLYTSHNGTTTGQQCPLLKNSAAAKEGNLASIQTLLNNNNPDDDTPTAEAVTAVTNAFPQATGPRVLVLATDGIPDTCADPDAHDDPTKALLAQQGSEQAVQTAFTKGIETYVLAVGPDVSAAHLQRLANAGKGFDLATGNAQFYPANNQAELNAAFNAIIGNARTCQFTLDAEVSDATKGTVTLNGNPLALDTDWHLLNPTTLELIGTACDTFLNLDNVDLQADFECGGAVIIVR